MANNYKYTYANIDKSAFQTELSKKGSYYSNVVMWTTLFSLPLFFLLDYLFCKDMWIDLMLIRLIGWGISYIIYTFANKNKWDYVKTLLLFIGVNIAVHSLVCAIVPSGNISLAYFLILAIVMLVLNTTIFWEPTYSIYMCLLSYAIIFILYMLKTRVDKYSAMIEHGGGVYFLISAFSCLLAYTRHNVLNKEVEKSLVIEETNNKLITSKETIKNQHFVNEENNREKKSLQEYKIDTVNVLKNDIKPFTENVKSSLEALKADAGNLTPSQLNIIDSIGNSNDKVNSVSEQLEVAAEAPKQSLQNFNKQYFDINPEVENAVIEIAESVQLKNMSLQLNISPAANNVYQDKLFTDQVLSKLLNNVVKISQSGSIITVRSEKRYGNAVVEAISHGAVLGMDALDEMFDKLRASSNSNEETINELGLASTKQLVESMNGTFTYQSDALTGNYFKIEFPSSQ
jgi:signal transduction histidine kinase